MSTAVVNETLIARTAEPTPGSDRTTGQASSGEPPQDRALDGAFATSLRPDLIQPEGPGAEHSRLGSARRTRVMKSLVCLWHSPDHHEGLAIYRDLPGSPSVHWLGWD